LLYPLVYDHIDRNLSAQYGSGIGMLNEFASVWFDESSRWVDATLKTAVSESSENAELLTRWISAWRTRVLEALQPIAELAFGVQSAEDTLRLVTEKFDARIARQGIAISQATAEVSHA
jgi:phenol hydroxylase P1 protein